METLSHNYTTSEELRNAYHRRGWRVYHPPYVVAGTTSRDIFWSPNATQILVVNFNNQTEAITEASLYTADEYS